MKNISLVKIITALFIVNVFVFSCSVIGTVGSSNAVALGNETSDNISDIESQPIGVGGTVDFIFDDDIPAGYEDNFNNSSTESTQTVSVVNLGFAKPSIVEKVVLSAYRPTDSVIKLANQGKNNSENEDSSQTSNENQPDISADDYPTPPNSEPIDEPVDEPVSTPVETSIPTSSTTPDENSEIPANSEDTNSSDSTNAPDVSDSESNSNDNSDTSDSQNSTTPISSSYDPNEILRVNNNGTEVSGTAVDIITKIVENEVGSTFAPEAIKAQAVAAYTYVKYSNLHGKTPYCILKESTNSSVKTLVQSVIGEGIYYNGELIQAVYSASSAGSTASSKNVWGGDIPYLRSVVCELDEKYDPNYGIKKTFTEEDIKMIVENNAKITLTGNPAEWFKITNRVEGKYVGDMTIGGQEYFVDKDGDTLKITGRRFRESIMNYAIRSSAFDIEYNADKHEFTVITYGYGHGVGLSQNGAQNIATQWGWDYKRILTFYFQGTEVY